MNLSNVGFALVIFLTWLPFSALANSPTVIECGQKASSAQISLLAEAWTSLDDQYQLNCPLLEEKELLKLVEKFGAGTTFAHPLIPGTCLSGTVTSGTLTLGDGTLINIDTANSYTESAQRLFPVPTNQGKINLFAGSQDGTLQVGAAMTAVHIEGLDHNDIDYSFNLLLDDKFLVTELGEDTEDFLIVGSSGDYVVTGRLIGRGQIISEQPLGILFEVTGSVCLR